MKISIDDVRHRLKRLAEAYAKLADELGEQGARLSPHDKSLVRSAYIPQIKESNSLILLGFIEDDADLISYHQEDSLEIIRLIESL